VTKVKRALVSVSDKSGVVEFARALAALGRSGVPAYVLYMPGRAPLLLPELLTPQRVLEALDG